MKTILTKEGLDKLQEEFNYLSNVEKQRIIDELSNVREDDAPEENSQYLIIKSEYEKLLVKIEKIRKKISSAVILDSNNIKTDKVMLLTSVKVLNMNNDKEMSFKIVPDDDINVKLGKISSSSPIGSGLLGKKVNDICDIKTPAGVLKLKILDITK
jgi:transcription elongation factor GreA